MALTIHGYQLLKKDIKNLKELKGLLTVRPYVPSVFVKPQYVQRYPVYFESEDSMYVPKHYGIETYGPPKSSTRNVEPSLSKYWEFTGSLRPSQFEVVNSFLKPTPRDGIISLQTGGGKTVCALYIASVLQVSTIVLVHNTFLRDQWLDRIKAFLPKARIGSVQGEVIDIENKDIVVAMLQSVSMKEYPVKTFQQFGLLIVDECHHIASEAFSQAIPKLTCKHMLGLSATPERKDRLMHVINWCLGPILYKSDTSDKVDEKVNVEVYEFEPPDSSYNDIIYNHAGVMFTSLMVNKVVEYAPRNKLLIEILTDLYDDNEREILVLTDRVDHTKVIFDSLPSHIQAISCILGRNVKSAQRAEWCESKRILIATYSMCKEGFDVAKLNTLVIATPRPDVDQIVGRILRTEKAKRVIDPLIIDIVDPAFRRQFQERLSLYNKRSYNVQKMKLA
jgi:superfamily II DNA or RNA helicase